MSVHCANAENPIRIEFDGMTRNQIKNEIVLFTTRDDRYRLSQETNFQLSFDRDANGVKDNPVYQASKPIIRTTYTIADTLNGVQVVANNFLIENSGTPLEKRTDSASEDETHFIQNVFRLVKESSEDMSKRAAVASLPKLHPHSESPSHSGGVRQTASKALFGKDADVIPQRLGFSARLSKDASHSGAVVVSVDPNTPADAAGLQANDIVTSIDGKSITNNEEIEAAKEKMKRKRRVKINVIRDGKQYDTMFRLR